jgi:rhamnose transport system permease protein
MSQASRSAQVLAARRTLIGAARRPEAILVGLLICALVLGSSLSPFFLTDYNFSNALQDLLERAIILLPMTALILAGHIDLSVASVMGLTGAVLARLLEAGLPIELAIVIVLVQGVMLGMLNGVLVAYVGLPSLIVTLATLSLYRGLAYVVLGGGGFAGFPAWFTEFGFGYIPGTLVPWPTLIFVALAIVFFVLLAATPFGRIVYAIGNNAEAVRFSGVRVRRTTMSLFVSSGAIAALAGVVYSARVASARADNAAGFELDIIAAVLLGGVSVFGGRGTLFGAILGLFLIGLLRNALTLADVSAEAQAVVVGALLIASILAPNISARLGTRLRSRRPSISIPASSE